MLGPVWTSRCAARECLRSVTGTPSRGASEEPDSASGIWLQARSRPFRPLSPVRVASGRPPRPGPAQLVSSVEPNATAIDQRRSGTGHLFGADTPSGSASERGDSNRLASRPVKRRLRSGEIMTSSPWFCSGYTVTPQSVIGTGPRPVISTRSHQRLKAQDTDMTGISHAPTLGSTSHSYSLIFHIYEYIIAICSP